MQLNVVYRKRYGNWGAVSVELLGAESKDEIKQTLYDVDAVADERNHGDYAEIVQGKQKRNTKKQGMGV